MKFFNELPYIGWLDTNGNFYAVDAFRHVEFARKICKDAGNDSYEATCRPDEVLLSAGWVKIQASMGQYHATWNKRLTYDQFSWLQPKIDEECKDDWHVITKFSFDLER